MKTCLLMWKTIHLDYYYMLYINITIMIQIQTLIFSEVGSVNCGGFVHH